MKFSILASCIAVATSFGLATAQEAARFGIVSVSPSVVKPGQVRARFRGNSIVAHCLIPQEFTVHYNSTLAVHHPKYYDAYIQGTDASGFVQPQFLLSRNDYGADQVNDYFTTTV